MSRNLLIGGLALLTSACVPIPRELAPASETVLTTEQQAECPGGYFEVLPGQSGSDSVLEFLPAYIDIVSVDSSLDGETLTAIFHLRGLPEEMSFNRERVEDSHLEYMWTVAINIEGDSIITSEQTDFTLAAFYAANRESAHTPAAIRPFTSAVQTAVWKHIYNSMTKEAQLVEVPDHPRLIVSHESNTLTIIGRIPGVTEESTLLFSTYDFLLGQDTVSCRPS